MRPKSIYTFALPVFFFISAEVTWAYDGFLNTLFGPLSELNIVEFYSQNHYWLDFFIYLLVFIPVVRLSIGKRFEGKEGAILSTAIGIALALSLSLMERRIGFSIKSFGPIAAAIFIFIIALLIFQVIRSTGAGSISAVSLAFAITYFMIRATVPNFFLWLEANQWTRWLHMALVMALAVSIWKIFKSIWPKSEIESLSHKLEKAPDIDPDSLQNIRMEKEEASLIKNRLERFTKKARKESRDIIEELKEMIDIIDEYGDTPQAKHLIAGKIQHIAPKENLILKQLAYIKDLSKKIEKFDLRSFKELNQKMGAVDKKHRDRIKEEIIQEKQKILSEEKLNNLESTIIKYKDEFDYCLKMAASSLYADQSGQARNWLLQAVQNEESAIKDLREMKKVEDRLLKLTKIEIRTMQDEEKEH